MSDNFPDLILSDGSQPLESNKNDYFLVTITDLIPGKTYPVEFRWNYKDPKTKADWGAVLNITTPTYAPSSVSSIIPAWSGSNFTLSFTHDPSASENANLSHYKIILISSGGTAYIEHPFKAGTSSQFYTVAVNKNSSPFNTRVNAISGSITAVDKDNNESAPVSFPLTTRTSSLPTPVITATAINNGYSIAYTTPSKEQYPEYDHIEIEEVQSNASTDPGTGYSSSFIGTANPAVVIVSSLNKRWVRAKFWDNAGDHSPYSTAVSTTPTTPITIDTTPPAAPSSGSVSAGIDTSSGSTVGFNAYLDISWTAVSDPTLKGYRIRFRKNGSSDPYGYVDSPGTGTSFRLNGLSIGVTYEIAIASYDEFNNTTGTYTSLGTASAGGTPYIGKNVSTTGYFEAAPSGETGAFRFGYGVQPGYRGLTFNANNYWYIDSSASASFKLGGSTANYISWDGFNFIVDGNIRAKGGYFAGQLEMQSGAGIYSGTVVSNTLTSDGFLLNTNGLIIKKGSISLRLDASDGGIYAQKGTIGNWTIDTNAIVSSSGSVPKITLNSFAHQIVASSNTYSAGIAIPEADSGSAIVFWAGQSGRTTSSKFYVTADGTLHASGVNVSGAIKATTGFIGSTNGSTGWTITSTGLETTSGSVVLNGTTGTISGATITGGTLQTSTDSNRIEITKNASNVGTITFYSSGTSNPGRISVDNPFSSVGKLTISGPDSNSVLHSYIELSDLGGNPNVNIVAGPSIGTLFLQSGSIFLDGVLKRSGVGTIHVGDEGIGGYKLQVNDDFYAYHGAVVQTVAHNANAWLNSTTGRLARSTSSLRYKTGIEDQDIPAQSILLLEPKSFFDKNEYLENPENASKILGLIAEDVAQIPVLKDLIVDYDSEGRPDAIAYSALAVAMIPLLKEINNRLNSIEQRLDALEG